MPLSLQDGWEVDEDDADTAQKMLGNMVLLSAKKNLQLGNCSFEQKRQAFKESSYSVTNQVAVYTSWGLEEIRARQISLASLAPKTWPLDFKRD